MKKILIITTVNDLSIPFFLTHTIREKIAVDFFFFYEKIAVLASRLQSNNFDYIYIRDPFNFIYDENNIKEKVEFVLQNYRESYLVDKIQSLDDIYFEDKWRQYQLFPQFMPETNLLKNINEIDNPEMITKKRISSRARGIVFNSSSKKLANTIPSDFIIQKKIKIDREYRVYVIFNEILSEGSIKTSQTELSAAKIVGVEKLSPAIINFVKQIIANNKFDFIGLDIAQSGDQLYLLEINRSCLFNGYFQKSGLNLAEIFIDKLLESKK